MNLISIKILKVIVRGLLDLLLVIDMFIVLGQEYASVGLSLMIFFFFFIFGIIQIMKLKVSSLWDNYYDYISPFFF